MIIQLCLFLLLAHQAEAYTSTTYPTTIPLPTNSSYLDATTLKIKRRLLSILTTKIKSVTTIPSTTNDMLHSINKPNKINQRETSNKPFKDTSQLNMNLILNNNYWIELRLNMNGLLGMGLRLVNASHSQDFSNQLKHIQSRKTASTENCNQHFHYFDQYGDIYLPSDALKLTVNNEHYNNTHLIAFMSLIALIWFSSNILMVMKNVVSFFKRSNKNYLPNKRIWSFSSLSLSNKDDVLLHLSKVSLNKKKVAHRVYLNTVCHTNMFRLLLVLTAMVGTARAVVPCSTAGGSASCAAAANMNVSNLSYLFNSFFFFHLLTTFFFFSFLKYRLLQHLLMQIVLKILVLQPIMPFVVHRLWDTTYLPMVLLLQTCVPVQTVHQPYLMVHLPSYFVKQLPLHLFGVIHQQLLHLLVQHLIIWVAQHLHALV